MRFAPSVLIGLLAVNGLAQTVADPEQQPEPSAIAEPQPSAPAAEPSAPVQQPTNPSSDGDNDDDDTPQSDAGTAPTAVPEPSANEPVETADASQVEQPTATATDDDDDDEASSAVVGTATADASATDNEATATATDTGDDDATNTATLTATESAAPTSTGAVVEVNLKNATIGDNAELIEFDGKPAIKLSAPANGQATFTVPVETDDDDFDDDELIYIVASILVGEGSAKLRKRATKTDCTLQIQAGSANVYNQPLYTTDGKFQDVKSSGIRSSDNPGAANVQVTQSCGDTPSPLTVGNVRAGTESGIKSSSGSGGSGGSGGNGSGGKGGSGSGSGSGTSTADGANASETSDSGNVGSKTRTSIGALAAAILAAAAFV
ncbi:hypothetical protein NW768_010653 [Fusarium equiseti]|uniref:Cell wall protein n=1 Tax=Fusarium equiseti TaxID=61235 RepID=A0ABQ8R0C7_FUSEQ|nr:hypothetical protein NW768_010653 [Fusarium equiseti]